MARKPTLSPSRLSVYLACPSKYRWQFVDPRGRWYAKPHSYFSFGTTLHRVLEKFHDSGNTGVETVGEALAAVDEDWVDSGYSNIDEMMEAKGEGKEIIQAYLSDVQENPRPGKTLFLEKTLRLPFEEFVLVGRLDRVDELPDGSLEIIDYKTGHTTVTPEDVAADLAMCCYQLLVKRAYPDRSVKATMIALRSGQEASASLSVEEMDEFEFDLKEVGHGLLCREWYELVPVWRPLCPSCDFLELCQKHHEFNEA